MMDMRVPAEVVAGIGGSVLGEAVEEAAVVEDCMLRE